MNHLLDEEREDFRVRLDVILHRPHDPWPPIDPMGWVKERQYNRRELTATRESFVVEREKSLAWLATLTTADWETVAPAPWGKIRAGDMLTAWIAHDMLHMRQLVELHWAWHVRHAHPFVTRYAGEW